MKKFTLLTSFFLCFTAFAQNGNEDKGIDVSGVEFPWELVIDRGKIIGCIYDNKYYSLGSILIEESVPRKCSLNSAREGFWSELSGSELAEFEEALEEDTRREKEREERIANSTYIGSKPITQEEAYIIRMIRNQVQNNYNKSLKQDK
jgi:hypothetical protein